MTSRQRISLQAEWWPAACRTQGWRPNDRLLRLRVCSWALSLTNPTALELLAAIQSDRQPDRQIQSTTELNHTTDIDTIKAALGMLADNVERTHEVGRPEIGRARRLRDVIRDQIKCLGLYIPRPRAYVAEIINDKFNRARRHDHLTIRDLTDDPIIFTDRKTGLNREIPSQLDQLVMTLSACLNSSGKPGKRQGFRVAAGHTLHEMKTFAGVRCDCAPCTRRDQIQNHLLPIPPLEENWTDFDPEPQPESPAPITEDPGQSENPF